MSILEIVLYIALGVGTLIYIIVSTIQIVKNKNKKDGQENEEDQ